MSVDSSPLFAPSFGAGAPGAALVLEGAAATAALAAAMAPRLEAGDTLLLEGPVGAGKTAFARALITARLAALGLHEEVPSPTFTLVQDYRAGGLEIWHADLYRLGDVSEIEELGLTEAFRTALCLIEWPDRLGGIVPPRALSLRFVPVEGAGDVDAEVRRLYIAGDAALLARLAPAFASPGPASR